MELRNHTLEGDIGIISLPIPPNVDRVLILVHGRGASAENILGLTRELALPASCLVVAPQAPGHTWYPERFIVSQAHNEPHLTTALSILSETVAYVEMEHNVPATQIMLAGFSQGACLVAEYRKRTPRRYRGAALMSGGLIGSAAEAAATRPKPSASSLSGTPIYLGCDEADPHIPKERVELSATYFSEHEAAVTMKLYQGLGHTIHPDGVAFIAKHLA